MTTFEITITIIAVLGVLLIGFMIYHFKILMSNAIAFFIRTEKQLSSVRADMYDDDGNHYLVEILNKLDNIEDNNDQDFKKLTDIVDKMHRNLCVEITDKMVERTFPIKKGEPLDAAFEPDYKLKKDIECKLNGFAAAVLDAECCPKEIVDFWLERICDAAHKYIKQLKIDWDKLSKEQQDEFLKRLIMPNYDSPFKPPFNPTCETTNKED